MHNNADWLVWPIIIVLVLIWAGLLGAYVTQREGRRRISDDPSKWASHPDYIEARLRKTDKRGGGRYS